MSSNTATDSSSGYWGEISANYDWCETNYAVTYYVAEFWNTLSSLTVVLAGLYFWRLSGQYKYGLRFKVASLGTLIIGVGSAAFHGTLQRWGQVLDEVPMLWSALIFFYICLMTLYLSKESEAKYGPALNAILTTIGTVVTYIYSQGGFVFFIVTYALAVTAISTMVLIKSRSSRAGAYALWAVALYAGGAGLLWLPEQILCGNRLEVSHESGLLALPVPLHAFFHVTSAIGPVCYLTFTTVEHLEKSGRHPVMRWWSSWESLGLSAPVAVPKGM